MSETTPEPTPETDASSDVDLNLDVAVTDDAQSEPDDAATSGDEDGDKPE